ncbi:hypothetical protein GGG16DRAFT_107972 [Schizophyllum commune]
MKVPRNNTAFRELPVHGEVKLAPRLAHDIHAHPYTFEPRYQMRAPFNPTLPGSELVRLREADWSSGESDEDEVVQEGTSFDNPTEPCGSFAAPALSAAPSEPALQTAFSDVNLSDQPCSSTPRIKVILAPSGRLSRLRLEPTSESVLSGQGAHQGQASQEHAIHAAASTNPPRRIKCRWLHGPDEQPCDFYFDGTLCHREFVASILKHFKKMDPTFNRETLSICKWQSDECTVMITAQSWRWVQKHLLKCHLQACKAA